VLEDGRAPYEWRGQDVRRGNGVGAWSELALVDEGAAIKVPDDLPLELACVFGCAVQTGVGAVLNTAQVPAGASVLVMGLGGVGMSIVQGARIAGATTIIASDPVAERRDAAITFGATHVVDPMSQDVVRLARDLAGGVDFAFDAVGSPKTVTTGFKATAIGGTVVMVGAPKQDDLLEGISHGLIVGQEKRLVGSMMGSGNAAKDIPMLVGLWRTGALKIDEMVTTVRPLNEVTDGLAELAAGRGLRTVLQIGDLP
jgi:Zn-dependent alcohol dehydrogenase